MVGWEPFLFNWTVPPNNVVKGITETVTISETRARVSTHARTLEESVISIESINRLRAITKTLTENLPYDNVPLDSYLVASFIPQSYTVAYEIARRRTANRSASGSILIGESSSRVKSGTKAIGIEVFEPSIIVSELLARRTTKKRRPTEFSYLDQSYTPTSFNLASVGPDVIIVSDFVTFVKPIGLAKTINETVTIGEAVTRLETKIRTAIETKSVTDSILNLSEKVREITDELTESSDLVEQEVITEAAGHQRSLIEDETIGEDILTQAEKVRTIDETTPITDVLQGWAKGVAMQYEAPPPPDITNIIGTREFYVRPQAPRPPRLEYELENTVYAPLRILPTLDNRISTPIQGRYQIANKLLVPRLRTQASHIGRAHSPLLTTPYPNPISLSLRLPRKLQKLESSLRVYQSPAQVALEPRRIINIERKYRTLKAYLLLHMIESLD